MTELSAVATDDKGYRDSGRSEVHALGDTAGAMFARLVGDAWDLGAGFAVIRPKIAFSISSPDGFLERRRRHRPQALHRPELDRDRLRPSCSARSSGLGLSGLEHTLPLHELAKQATRLRKGEIESMSLQKLRGGLRAVGQDINGALDRVAEKGGGGRKPADLESILGPVPAQPAMSAFSFPMKDGAGPPNMSQPVSGGRAGPVDRLPSSSTSAARRRRQMARRCPPRLRAVAPVPVRRGCRRTRALCPRPSRRVRIRPRPRCNTPQPPRARSRPPVGPIGRGAPPIPRGPVSGGTLALGATRTPAPNPPPLLATLASPNGEEEEATMVGAVPPDVFAQAGGGDGTEEWNQVYQDFLKTKKECGEPIDGLTFDKFSQTLKKNRDALIQRHGCKRVRFQVYVKEGRASLKATPVQRVSAREPVNLETWGARVR